MAHGRRIALAVLALTCLGLAGCAWQPQQVVPEAVVPPGADVTFQPVTPPPPLHENIPDSPSDAYAWVPGRWMWRSHDYIWKSGAWVIPPRPGARWVPDKWSPGYTTPDVPGHWE